MDPKEILDELKTILVSRLKFDPRRAADMTLETPLPKGVEGSIGLDSLDFIELSIAIEERFGIAMDESQDLTRHFLSFDTLTRFITARMEAA
jgi:acyl carrier protein